ncbi:MAG: S-methyl-5-thioribose-1-phosphate isomerase [Candidatus Gastranaerophilales bacterium]|nr:S-methyl-5-thioribose-1-phosphate isomerase [Candidatus Gastranaerophilales bacterium]
MEREGHKSMEQHKGMEQTGGIMDVDTVSLDEERDAIVIIDQTLLPGRIELICLRTAQEIWDAIYQLKVRGAPAIGVTAAFGIYLSVKRLETEDFSVFMDEFARQKAFLGSARPTAVNLFWALERMERTALRAGQEGQSVAEVKKSLQREALCIRDEDIQVCRKIGERGLELLKPGDGILTHCNAGKLAAVRYGTATAPIYLGQERGYGFKVYADETRPLLQGARLTAFELYASGVDVTLICDNMSASIMAKGLVQAVLVGCDRVAANGDTANKIGTSVVAAVAKHYNVPVYICAPTSTIDMNTPTGAQITIEQRSGSEVTEMWYRESMAPAGVKVYNPAFDVTEHELIAGIVTEYGVVRAPYTEGLRRIMEYRQSQEE